MYICYLLSLSHCHRHCVFMFHARIHQRLHITIQPPLPHSPQKKPPPWCLPALLFVLMKDGTQHSLDNVKNISKTHSSSWDRNLTQHSLAKLLAKHTQLLQIETYLSILDFLSNTLILRLRLCWFRCIYHYQDEEKLLFISSIFYHSIKLETTLIKIQIPSQLKGQHQEMPKHIYREIYIMHRRGKSTR